MQSGNNNNSKDSSSSNNNDRNQLRGSESDDEEKIDQVESSELQQQDGEQNGIDRVWSVSDAVIVPTKAYDGGGGMNYTRPNHAQQQQPRQQQGNNGVGSTGETMATETTTSRPDSFQTYSDRNMRMAALLGLEPASNPHDGDERENWRQLTGFQGLGGRHRRPNENEEDDDAAARVEVEGQLEPNNVDASTSTTPRQTRLSWELHLSVFENMWTQNGDLGPPLDEDSNMPEQLLQRYQQPSSELDTLSDNPYDIILQLHQLQRQRQQGEAEESNDEDANGQAG